MIVRSTRILVSFCAVVALSHSAQAITYVATVLSQNNLEYANCYGAFGDYQVGSGLDLELDTNSHAMLWNGTPASAIDLHPAGYQYSIATSAYGTNQAGYGLNISDNQTHALLWNGSAASVTDLQPEGATSSIAFGVSSTYQAGSAFGPSTGGNSHAMLWNGSAASAVDLHPPDLPSSQVRGISETNQVGYAWRSSRFFVAEEYAFLWSGTAASAINLNPPGYALSEALATSGPTQVGAGSVLSGFSAEYHALLWHGTAESYVDLNPAGFVNSSAYGVSGDTQVGYGLPTDGYQSHALVWSGSAASAIDLHQFITALNPAFTDSFAFGISANGIISGHAIDAAGHSAAIQWTPVPEPASYALFVEIQVCASFLFFRLRRRLAKFQTDSERPLPLAV